MKSFIIKDQRAFTSQLFTGSLFDGFLLCEADFKTSMTIHIDGSLCKDYYDEADEIPEEKYNIWKNTKGICFQIIKGKKLPVFFKVVLTLSSTNIENTVKSSGTTLSANDVGGMYINVHYKDGAIFCTSGISLNVFSMDKELADYWDRLVMRFFTQNKIDFE